MHKFMHKKLLLYCGACSFTKKNFLAENFYFRKPFVFWDILNAVMYKQLMGNSYIHFKIASTKPSNLIDFLHYTLVRSFHWESMSLKRKFNFYYLIHPCRGLFYTRRLYYVYICFLSLSVFPLEYYVVRVLAEHKYLMTQIQTQAQVTVYFA